MGFPHRVPLSDRALALLREVRALGTHPATGLVFPGGKPGCPCSGSAVLGLLRRHHLSATVHGLRSSFRDWVAETEQGMDEAAERALAHARTDQTVAAYLRTDLLDVRRGLMRRRSDHVCGGSGDASARVASILGSLTAVSRTVLPRAPFRPSTASRKAPVPGRLLPALLPRP